MREGDAGQARLVLDLLRQDAQELGQPDQQQIRSLPQPQRLDVVQHIHAGGAQVDDATAHRALLGIRANLGHQVVTDLRLDLRRALQVDIALVGHQVSQLLGANQPRLVLRRRQSNPKAPQQQALVQLRPDRAHLLGAVAPGEGGEVGVVGVHEV